MAVVRVSGDPSQLEDEKGLRPRSPGVFFDAIGELAEGGFGQLAVRVVQQRDLRGT